MNIAVIRTTALSIAILLCACTYTIPRSDARFVREGAEGSTGLTIHYTRAEVSELIGESKIFEKINLVEYFIDGKTAGTHKISEDFNVFVDLKPGEHVIEVREYDSAMNTLGTPLGGMRVSYRFTLGAAQKGLFNASQPVRHVDCSSSCFGDVRVWGREK